MRQEHILDTYIDTLTREKLISPKERLKLYEAITPLLEMFPDLPIEIIRSVRNEFSEDPKPTKYEIADEERELWKKATAKGITLIDGFNVVKAKNCFTVPKEKQPRKVLFLRPEYERKVPIDDVPYALFKGEVFFYIILRMFRRYFEQLRQSAQM